MLCSPRTSLSPSAASSGSLTIRSLAAGAPHARGNVERVRLFTANGPATLEYGRSADGLSIRLPERRPGDYVFTFEIAGAGLDSA